MKNKKGDIWVSAVLYFGLGIIVISIILAAGLPVINKLKDKNILIQTKELFNVLDENMLTVISGGPDSQRPIKLDIKKGEIKINDKDATPPNTIIWRFEGSRTFASEPTNPSEDPLIVNLAGTRNVKVKTIRSNNEGRYDIEYILDYDNIAIIETVGGETKTIRGTTKKIIRNEGVDTITTPGEDTDASTSENLKPKILIKQI